MDNREFSSQIGEAVEMIGAQAAAECMARALIYIAHASMSDIDFTCEQGTVEVVRQTIASDSKH